MSLSAAESLEIMQLVARADNCATARDADGYAALFTEEAMMTGVMGCVRGRAALRDAVAAVWAAEPPRTLHLTLNTTIDASGRDQPSPASCSSSRATPSLIYSVPRWSATSCGAPRRGGGLLQGRFKVREIRQAYRRPTFGPA